MALEEAGAVEEARAVPAVEMAVREARADEAVTPVGPEETVAMAADSAAPLAAVATVRDMRKGISHIRSKPTTLWSIVSRRMNRSRACRNCESSKSGTRNPMNHNRLCSPWCHAAPETQQRQSTRRRP